MPKVTFFFFKRHNTEAQAERLIKQESYKTVILLIKITAADLPTSYFQFKVPTLKFATFSTYFLKHFFFNLHTPSPNPPNHINFY